MRYRHYMMLSVLLMLVCTFPTLARSQAPRRPVTISADSTLPLRVLARPLSHIYRGKDAKEVVKENVPTFQSYYVYTRPELKTTDTRPQGWYEVGSNNRGEVLGWMRAEDVIEWKQTMSLAYTHAEGRHPVLMFARQQALSELIRLPTPLRQQRVRQFYAAIESGQTPAEPPQRTALFPPDYWRYGEPVERDGD